MIRLFLIIAFLFPMTTVSAQDWKVRKDWPNDFPRPPKSKNSLFFIQRNRNVNTIIYDLNIKDNGQIDERNPISVYWLKYKNKGERKELLWLEKKFAYGYRSKKNKTDESFNIKLIAYKDRKIHLKKVSGKWKPFLTIDNQQCYLTNIYVYADESGWWPKVHYVDLYGNNTKTGAVVKERIFNK